MSSTVQIARQAIRVVERLTRTTITVRRRPRVSVKLHPNACGDGSSMALYVELVQRLCTFTPSNIFEIGANYGQDAEVLRKSFNISSTNVYTFEPHPDIVRAARALYNSNSYDVAVSNITGRTTFHAVNVETNEYGNSGISSLRRGKHEKSNFADIEVEVTRMDDFLAKHPIAHIDFLKVDVEGSNYEVLDGFGRDLSKVKAVQVEAEHKPFWEGQRLYADIEELLKRHNFDLVYFSLLGEGIQSDSFWVQTQYLARR